MAQSDTAIHFYVNVKFEIKNFVLESNETFIYFGRSGQINILIWNQILSS